MTGGDATLIRDLLELGVSGILIAAVFYLVSGKVIPKPIHDIIVGDRDKQIEGLKEEKTDLNTTVRELSSAQIDAVQDIVETQKETLHEQRKTIDLLLELSRRSGSVTSNE